MMAQRDRPSQEVMGDMEQALGRMGTVIQELRRAIEELRTEIGSADNPDQKAT